MWHRKRWFGGGWFIWVFFFLFISGALGKSGIPGFVIPMIFLWVFLPMFFGSNKDHGKHRRVEKQVYRQASSVERSVQPRAAAQPARTAVGTPGVPAARSIDDLPAHCSSCGGPVDETTVKWRGSSAACGFCGTGLRSRPQ